MYKMASSLRSLKARIFTSSIAKRIARGAFWSFTGTAGGKFFILVAGILCARVLGKEGYGQLGIVRSTVSLFVSLGSAGMGVTAAKFVAQYKNINKEEAAKIASITRLFACFAGMVAAIAILVFAETLAAHALHTPSLAREIRVGALLIFITILNGAQNGILSGVEDFKAIARNTFVASAVEGLLMVAGAKAFGVFGAVLGYGLGYVVLYVCNRLSIVHDFKAYGIRPRLMNVRPGDLRVLYKFSLPSALSGTLVMPAYWVVRMLLVRYNGFGELGIYEAADQWRMIILFVPAALSQIVLPILSNVQEEGSSQTFWKIIWFNIGLNAVITLGLSLLVLLCGNWLMGLNGKEFTGSSTVVCLAFSTVFSSAATIMGNALASRECMWQGFGFNVLWALMFIGFTWIALQYGLQSAGVAMALLMAYAIHTTLQLLYLRFILK